MGRNVVTAMVFDKYKFWQQRTSSLSDVSSIV